MHMYLSRETHLLNSTENLYINTTDEIYTGDSNRTHIVFLFVTEHMIELYCFEISCILRSHSARTNFIFTKINEGFESYRVTGCYRTFRYLSSSALAKAGNCSQL